MAIAGSIQAALRAAEKDGSVKSLVVELKALTAEAGLSLGCREDVENLERRKRFFLKRSYLPFIHKLVHGVGSSWLPLFTESEKKECFDVFFSPCSSEGAHCTLQGLAIAVTICEDQFTLTRLLQLAQSWFECGGIGIILAEDRKRGEESESQREQIQVLLALPDRIANRLQGRVPQFFAITTYFSHLASKAIDCARVGEDATERGGPADQFRTEMVDWDWLGQLLGGIATGGHGSSVADELCSLLGGEGSTGTTSSPQSFRRSSGNKQRWGAAGMDMRRDEEEREAENVREIARSDGGRRLRKAIQSLPEASVEAVLSAAVLSSSRCTLSSALVLCMTQQLPLARRMLFDKFLVGRTWTDGSCHSSLLLPILALELDWRDNGNDGSTEQRTGRLEEGPVVRALRALGNVWGESHFVQHGGMLQQKQVTWLLKGCVRHVRGREELESFGLIGIMVKAIQARMENPIPDRREDAKRTAEMFAFRLDPAHALKFDEEGEESDCDAEEEGHDYTRSSEDKTEFAKPEGRDGMPNEDGQGQLIGRNARPLKVKRQPRVAKPLTDDPDRVVLDSDSECGDSHSEASQSSQEEEGRGDDASLSESDSDDGLVPYEMDDDETCRDGAPTTGEDEQLDASQHGKRLGAERVPLPTRMRQCVSGLRSQNADEVEAALFAVEGVVRGSQGVAGDESAELAWVLLRLEDRIAMHDFDGRRHAGLVALACKDPVHVAPRLSQAVWEAAQRLTFKLDALHVLSDAAFLLSALPSPSEMPSAQEEDAEAVGRQVGKTRRWSRKSLVRRPEAKANEFGPLAPAIFFSLLSGWDPATAPRLLSSDYVLAGRIIAVLGCYVECSGNAPATPALAKALMQVVSQPAVRLHAESFVRRCVQYALSRLLLAVPERVFCSEFHQELGWLPQWLHETYQEDADVEVAKMAGGNFSLVSDRAALAAPSLSAFSDLNLRTAPWALGVS